jgi:hypothetical protein
MTTIFPGVSEMKMRVLPLSAVLILALLLPVAGYGQSSGSKKSRPKGTLEWEAGVQWWASEYGMTGGNLNLNENDAGELGFRGEIWFPQHFGFLGQYLPTDTSGMSPGAADVTYASLDALYRIDTVSKNNYIAIGAGWEYADLSVNNTFGKTDGPRAVLAVRLGSKKIYSYGEFAYMWKMSRINVGDTIAHDLSNIRGDEYEFGGGYILGEHVQLRLGYRRTEFRMDRSDVAKYKSRSTGWLLGAAVVF